MHGHNPRNHQSTVHETKEQQCPLEDRELQPFGKFLVEHLRSDHLDDSKSQATEHGRSRRHATPASLHRKDDLHRHYHPEREQDSPACILPRGAAHLESPSTSRENGFSSDHEVREDGSLNYAEPAFVFKKDAERGLVPSWLRSVVQENGSSESQPRPFETPSQENQSPHEGSSLLRSPSENTWSSNHESSEGDDSDIYGGDNSILGEEDWVSSLELGPYGFIVRQLKALYANCLYRLIWQQVSQSFKENESTTGATAAGDPQLVQNSGLTGDSSSHGKKRKTGGNSDNWRNKGSDRQGNDDDKDDGIGPPSSSKRVRSNTSASLRFACPFFKRHPDIFISCGMADHEDPSRVKLHINRKHRMPIYCPRCSDVFKSEKERDSHLRNINCTIQPEIQRICATSEQIQKLSRRTTLKTDRDRWNEIYCILFPTDPLPESPYLDRTVSAEVNLVREAFLHAAPAAVRTAIRMAIPEALQETFGDEELERIVHATHIEVFDQVLSRIQSNRSGSRNLRSSFNSDASISHDSGIAGSSNAETSQAGSEPRQDRHISPLPELTDTQLEEIALEFPFNWSFAQDTDLTL